MIRRLFSVAAFALCLCGLTLLTGCKDNTKAGGTVSFSDGAPLDRGLVKFETPTNQYTANIQPDGSFELGGVKAGDGLPPGHYKVSVSNVFENDVPILDAKFEDPEKSGIAFDVVKGQKDRFKITVERSAEDRTPPPVSAFE